MEKKKMRKIKTSPIKTESIRLCIQAQYGKEDYDEARMELNAILERISQLESKKQVKGENEK